MNKTSSNNNPPFLCQPGKGKGCCVCCGLFNMKNISKDTLARVLCEGQLRKHYWTDFNNSGNGNFEYSQNCITLRDAETHVCPFMGFINHNTPGCMAHPSLHEGIDKRDRSLFGRLICNNYFCPAYTLLDDREKRILVNCTSDWYSYAIGIIDPEGFKWIIKTIEEKVGKPIVPETADEITAQVINESLLMVGRYFNQVSMPVVFYSVPEYCMNLRYISPGLCTGRTNTIAEDIADYIFSAMSSCHF